MPRPKQQELRQPELRQGEHGIPMGNKLCQEFWEEQPQLEEKLGEFSGTNQHADGRSQPIQYSVPNRRTNYSKNKTYARRNPSGRNWIDRSVAGKNYESSSKNLCYYHYTFGTNAHKCQPPCNWHKVVSKNLNASPDH